MFTCQFCGISCWAWFALNIAYPSSLYKDSLIIGTIYPNSVCISYGETSNISHHSLFLIRFDQVNKVWTLLYLSSFDYRMILNCLCFIFTCLHLILSIYILVKVKSWRLYSYTFISIFDNMCFLIFCYFEQVVQISHIY